MAIEDGPRANYEHWQKTYGPVLARYRQATEMQKTALANLASKEEAYAKAKEAQNKDLAEINQAIKDLSKEISMIVPVSTYPSLIIDDPDYPPPDQAAADDMWTSIANSLQPHELRDLLRDQSELQRLRKKREGLLFRITHTESEDPTGIEEAKQFLEKSSKELLDAGAEYDKHKDAIEGSPFSQTTVALKGVSGKGEVGNVKEGSASVTVGFDVSAKGIVIPAQAEKEIAAAKKAAEIAEEKRADEEKRRILAEARLDAVETAQAVLRAKADMPTQLVIETDVQIGFALKSATTEINLQPHKGDDKSMLRNKEWLNEVQPVGKILEVNLEEKRTDKKGSVRKEADTHVRRSLAVRAGVHLEGHRTSIFVSEHIEMNKFLCQFVEEGKWAILGLGRGYNNVSKTIIVMCISQYAGDGWTEAWECSVPNMPEDYLANVNYKPERLLEFHELAMTAWSQKVTTEAIVNPIVDDVISIATNGKVP